MESSVFLLKNNGLKSFIPPCFSWELYSEDGLCLIETVSELDLSLLNLNNKEELELYQQMYKGNLLVKGYTNKIGIYTPSQAEGIRFTIEEILE